MKNRLRRLLMGAVAFLAIVSGTPSFAQVNAIKDINVPVPRLGNKTDLPSNERIISLANGAMEVLYALGVEKYVVGRDIASTFKGSERIPIVTNGHSISAEKVLKLKPTLMLVNKSSGPAKALQLIKKSGVRIVVIPEAYSIDKMLDKYQAILEAIKLPSSSSAAEALLKNIPAQTSSESNSALRVAFLYLRGTSSIYLMGGKGSGADDLIAASGGIDVGKEMGLPSFSPITSEAVIRSNPTILLLMEKGLISIGGVRGVRNLPGIAQTPAGTANNVITVDDSLLLSFGPRTSILIDKLIELFNSYQSMQG